MTKFSPSLTMRRIEWTQPAQIHLRKIRAYIAQDSAENAQRLVEAIREAVLGTQLFPEAGSQVPEWDSADAREIFVGQYRIIYDFDDDVINVLAVIHGARQLPGTDEI